MSDGKAPSEAAIRARIDLEMRIDLQQQVLDLWSETLDWFEKTSSEWRGLINERKNLSGAAISTSDSSKLEKLERSVVEQLGEYGFSSVEASEIGISQTTYRPEHEGFDLGFDLSASDMIRTIWAYIYGLLEVSRVAKTNHPGVVIFG